MSRTTMWAHYLSVFRFECRLRYRRWCWTGIRSWIWHGSRFRRNGFAIVDWSATESAKCSIFFLNRFALRTDRLVCRSRLRSGGETGFDVGLGAGVGMSPTEEESSCLDIYLADTDKTIVARLEI